MSLLRSSLLIFFLALILLGSGCASHVKGVGAYDGDRTLERKMQKLTPLGTSGSDALAAIYRQTRKGAPQIMAYGPWVTTLERREVRDLTISEICEPEIWAFLTCYPLPGIIPFPETARAHWTFSPAGKLEKIEIRREVDGL